MQYNVLAVGVSPQWLATAAEKGYSVGPKLSQAKIEEAMKKSAEATKEFSNTDFVSRPLVPDDEGWTEYAELVKSRKWDVISLGGGVRTIPELSDFFTNMINCAVEAHPQAKLIFPLDPSEIVPSLRKHVPRLN